MSENPCFLTVTEASHLIASGRLCPVELTIAHLERIRAFDGSLNSHILITEDIALHQAETAKAELGSGRYRGALHGIPFGVKDIIDVAGLPTTANSAAFNENVATSDAFVMARMREAGAILLGKHALHELAYGGVSEQLPWPSARNPWDHRRDTGGSSSGSGAAVAARMAMLAIGTDTGGSVRNPAAHCGLVGLKPTFGRVSRRGIMQNSWTLDHCGPLTRTCEDSALVMDVISGFDREDDASIREQSAEIGKLSGKIKGTRIALIANWYEEDSPAPAHVRSALAEAVYVLEGLGATVTKVNAAPLQEYASCKAIIQMPEIRAEYEELIAVGLPFGSKLMARFELALSVSAFDYVRAQTERRAKMRAFEDLMGAYDAVITAGPYGPAPFICDLDADWVFNKPEITVPFSLLGVPALSLCIGFSGEGLPLSMQIAGRAFDEACILNIGHAYQRATDWHRHHPSLDELPSA